MTKKSEKLEMGGGRLWMDIVCAVPIVFSIDLVMKLYCIVQFITCLLLITSKYDIHII